MNILYLSTDFPFPLTSGGRGRAYNMLKALSLNHIITMVSFHSYPVSDSEVEAMKSICREIVLVPLNLRHSVALFIKSLLTNVPYKVLQFTSQEFRTKVETLLAIQKIDVIFSESVYLAPYLLNHNIPSISQNNDMFFNVYKRISEQGDFIMRLYSKTQWKKILAYEKEVYGKVGVFIALSREEVELVKTHIPSIRVGFIPNGVNIEYYTPMNEIQEPFSIVLTGAYSYFPNEQSALFFAKKVFPGIKKMFPTSKFYIVGKNPTDSIKKLTADHSIIVTGEVQDMRPHLAKAEIVVAPVLIAGGTRNKILEAMAMRKPIVSTSIGCEGLNVQHEKNIFVADGAENFKNGVIRLFQDKQLASKIAQGGRTLVESEYRWDVIGAQFNEFLSQYVNEKSSTLGKDVNK